MKYTLCLLLCSMLTSPISGQGTNFWNRCGDKFDQTRYPVDSFAVQTQAFSFGETKIILTILQYKFESADQVWIEQRRGRKLLKSKYLGDISSGESGVAIPKQQPFKELWMFRDDSEFTGIYYLITNDGVWYEIPGGSIMYDKTSRTLFTDAPPECGGCTIGKFSLQSHSLKTKVSKGEEPAWKEVGKSTNLQYLFREVEWVHWKKQ